MANTKVTSSLIADNAIGIDQLNLSDGTNGQVLVTDGAGTLSFSTISGYTDSDVETYLNTSEIYTDPTNNRLGIGNASPSYTLTVQKDVDSFVMKVENDGNSPGTSGNSYADASDGLWVDTRWNTATNTPFKVTSNSGNTPMMIIKGDGKVGIGTDNPGSKLQVQADGIGIRLDGTANTTRTIFFRNTTSSNPAQIYSDGSLRLFTEDAGTDIRFHTNSNGTNNERMRIDSAGRVGIGVLNPATPLHVTDSNNYTYSTTVDASANMAGMRLTNSNNNSNWAGLWFATGSAAGTHWSGIAGCRTDAVNTWGTHLAFYTHEDSLQNLTQATERMRIDSSGNVGIGTTSVFDSNTRLELKKSGNCQFFVSSSDASGVRIVASAFGTSYGKIGTYSNHALRFDTNDTERMRINGSDLLIGWTGGTFNDPGYNSQDGISLRGQTNSPTIIISKADSSGVYNYYSYRRGNNSNGNHMLFEHGGTVGTITTTYNGSTSYNTTSDYRLKENIEYEFNALERVTQLKPARFNFISNPDTTVDGFLAHEVQDIVPEAIHGIKDEMQEEEYEVTPAVLDEDGNVVTEAVMGTREVPVYQGIDQSKLVPLLTKAIQEQQTIINDLKARIETLEG